MKHCFILAVLAMLTGCVNNFESQKKMIPVLCLASYDTKTQGLDGIEPEAIEAYRSQGFDLHFNHYQKIDPNKLKDYSVVIGMIPGLHAGTKAIDHKLGRALEEYMRNGGGLLLIPGPSYYGVTDFVKQLNPWLKQFDVALLSEIPVDLQNQKNITRVLDYRYLKTTNIAKHKVTEGINELWFPLDFSNSYVRTHTMNVGPEWNVLVKGEKSCRTYPFEKISKGKKVGGRYQSEPPFFAIRDVGKGKFALLTSASRYFIFDAYHWAHGSGFVLNNNGLKLMTQLLGYLAEGHSVKVADKEGSETMSQGNVTVEPNKKAWMNNVIKNLKPKKSGVKYYVDCGAMTDLAYTNERGYGYLDIPYTNWVIRWPWSDIFHATASNSRAFDTKSLSYQFDKLAPQKQYWLGILVWGYQQEGCESILLKNNNASNWQKVIELPKRHKGAGPKFELIDIPAKIIKNGTLNLKFSVLNKKQGGFSSICELWLFEQGPGNDMQADELMAEFEPAAGIEKEKSKNLNNYNGLIGVKSNYTVGQNSVAEYAAAAKKAGFSFIVFTDELEQLGPENWQKLIADCKQASGDSFRAIPGFLFTSRYKKMKYDPNNPHSWGEIKAYVFQHPAKYPTKEMLENPYELYWKLFGGELTAGKRTAPTLIHPGKNKISPFFQRFWRGFNVFTLNEQGLVIDDAEKMYKDLLAAGYGPYPRVSGDYRSVEDIQRAAHGWKTIIPALNLDKLTLFDYASYISSGPRLIRFNLVFNQLLGVEIGGGIVMPGTDWAVADIKLKAKTSIKKVTLFSGEQVLRTWHPDQKVFKVKEPVLLGKQHQIWLKALTADNKKLITGPMQISDHKFMQGMCADNQNTICNLTNKPTRFVRDEREIYLQHSYWHTGEAAGQIGSLKNARSLVPRIVEVGIIQPVKHFEPTPKLIFEDGSSEKHLQGEMRIKESNRECNNIEYQFNTPGSKTSSIVNITSYRTLPNGSTTFLVENTLTAKKDIVLKDEFSLQVLSLAMMPPLAPKWKFSYIQDNKVVSRDFSALSQGEQVKAHIQPKSGIMIWPNDIGNLLVLPLDDQQYTVAFDRWQGVWNGREHVSFFRPVKELQKGTRVTSRFLVVLYSGKIESADSLKSLTKQFTDYSAVVSKLNVGALVSTGYPITVNASEYAVKGQFNSAHYPDPIPVRVLGINSNWSCGIWQNGELEIIEGYNDFLECVLHPDIKDLSFAAGNLLCSDDRQVKLEWAGIYNDSVRFHVHNPSGQSRTVTIRNNKTFKKLPEFNISLTLKPGESKWCRAKGDDISYETK